MPPENAAGANGGTMQPPRLETDRLILRDWAPQDVRPFSRMCADPQVMRYIGSGRCLSADESAAAVAAFRSSWDRHGFGLFALETRDTGDFAGFCGLSIPSFLPEILPAVEIGWRLAGEFWGRGLATEAARECLRFGFDDAGLDEVSSIHQIGNDASERIMRKLGMVLERRTVDPTCRRRVNVYRIGCSDWRRASRPGTPI